MSPLSVINGSVRGECVNSAILGPSSWHQHGGTIIRIRASAWCVGTNITNGLCVDGSLFAGFRLHSDARWFSSRLPTGRRGLFFTCSMARLGTKCLTGLLIPSHAPFPDGDFDHCQSKAATTHVKLKAWRVGALSSLTGGLELIIPAVSTGPIWKLTTYENNF